MNHFGVLMPPLTMKHITATILAGFLLLSGCHARVRNRVQVIDMETRQPISGAKVVVSFGVGFPKGPLFRPAPSRATTDEFGIAVLRATWSEDTIPQWHVDAAGYTCGNINYQTKETGDALRAAIESGDLDSIVPTTIGMWRIETSEAVKPHQ
jgi:hypothetical protein